MNHVATAADTQCINTLRTLAMDAVQKANSGHPGTPMGLAPVGYTLWSCSTSIWTWPSGRKQTWAERHKLHNDITLFNPAPIT